MKELLRLAYLVVVILPLTLLLIGPSLVLAALRGRQKIGPIVLYPGRRGGAGRIGALLFGLLLWLVVWAGLAVVLSGVILPAIGRPSSPRLQANVTPTALPMVPPLTPTPPLSATPRPTATPTATNPPGEEAATSTSSPVLSPSPTPSPPPPTSTQVLPTAVPVLPTPTPTPTPTLTPLSNATLTTPSTPLAALPPAEAGKAINAVEMANDLLRAAVMEPSIGNLAALETIWRGEALVKAQAFAQDLSQRYLPPLDVTYVYLTSPLALEGTSPDTASVISTEAWTYTGPRSAHGESLEFTYTLRRDGEGWVITDYAYNYAPITLPSGEGDRLTPSPIPSTITATIVITPSVVRSP